MLKSKPTSNTIKEKINVLHGLFDFTDSFLQGLAHLWILRQCRSDLKIRFWYLATSQQLISHWGQETVNCLSKVYSDDSYSNQYFLMDCENVCLRRGSILFFWIQSKKTKQASQGVYRQMVCQAWPNPWGWSSSGLHTAWDGHTTHKFADLRHRVHEWLELPQNTAGVMEAKGIQIHWSADTGSCCTSLWVGKASQTPGWDCFFHNFRPQRSD